MKSFNICIDDKFHKEVKSHVANEGKSIKDYVSELIRKDMDKRKPEKK